MELVQLQNAMPEGTSIDAVKMMSETLSSAITEKKRGNYIKAAGLKRERRDLLAHLLDKAGSSTGNAASVEREEAKESVDHEDRVETKEEEEKALNDVEDSKRDISRNHVICMKTYYPHKDKRGNSTGEPVLIVGTRDGYIVVSQLEPPFDHVNTYKMHDKAITALQVYQPPGEALITILSASLDKDIKVSIMLSGNLVSTLRHHETQRQKHYREEKVATFRMVKSLQERKAKIKARKLSPVETAKAYSLMVPTDEADSQRDSDEFDMDDKAVSITKFEKDMGMELENIELSIFEVDDDMDDDLLYKNELKALEKDWMKHVNSVSESALDKGEVEASMREDLAQKAQEREAELDELDLKGHSRAVFSIDLLHQHQSEPLVLSASLDGTVKLWSLLRDDDHKVIHSIHTSVGAIFKAKIFAHPYVLQGFANGSLSHHEASADIFVLVAGEDRTARLFSLQDGLEKQVYGDPVQLKTFGHQARITDIASVWDNHLYENTTTTSKNTSGNGDRLAQTSVGMHVFNDDEHYDFIAHEEKNKTFFRTVCGGCKKLCCGCCCYYDKCCNFSCCPDKKYMSTISTESQKKKARMWTRLLESEEDDIGVAVTDPIVITSCIDGKIRVFHAISGVLIRQLFDETLVHSTIDHHGVGELSPIYCVQTYEVKASNRHKQEVRRKAMERSRKVDNEGIDFNRLGEAFLNPLGGGNVERKGQTDNNKSTASKRGIVGRAHLIIMLVRCIFNIFASFVSFVYGAGTETHMDDEDEDFINLMNMRDLSAGEYLDGLCGVRIYAGHRNGKILCWDITSGSLILDVMTESEKPVVGLDIMTEAGDVYWPESKSESTKQWFEKYIAHISGCSHHSLTDFVSGTSKNNFEELRGQYHKHNTDDSKNYVSEDRYGGSRLSQGFTVNNPILKDDNDGKGGEEDEESDIMDILRRPSTLSSTTCTVSEVPTLDEIPEEANMDVDEDVDDDSAFAKKKRREQMEKALSRYEPSRSYLKPRILSVSLQGRLEYAYDTNTFQELFKAYREDKYYLLPKSGGRNGKIIDIPEVPLEFRDWPRVYFLSTCKRYGTLSRLFYGTNFFIFFVAVHDRSDSFVSTFLPYAGSGITMESYTMTIRGKVDQLAHLKTEFDSVFDNEYAPTDLNQGCCPILYRRMVNLDIRALFAVVESTVGALGQKTDRHGTTFLSFCCRKNINNSFAIKNALAVWKDRISTPPVSLMDQTAGPGLLLGTSELCSVAMAFPHEFQTFLCAIEPLQAHTLTSMNCDTFIENDDSTKFAPSSGTLKGDYSLWQEDGASLHEELICFYLPLGRPTDRRLMSAVNQVCERIDSSKIFASSFGRIVNTYAWRGVFRSIHNSKLGSTIRLAAYVAFLCSFALPPTSSNITMTELQVLVTIRCTHVALYIYIEGCGYVIQVFQRVKESGVGWLAFLGNLWNVLDVMIYIIAVVASWNIAITYRYFLEGIYASQPYQWEPYSHQAAVSIRILMATLVLMLGVKLLGFFRAYESTGILVALVVETLRQMKTYLFIILIVIVAFAESFWAITLAATGEADYENDDALAALPGSMAFGSMRGSMVTLFRWSFGNFDPTQLQYLNGFTLHFCVFLACLFMLLVTVVLFNLLIAYMADVFVALQNKGKSEWGRILSKTMSEMDYFAYTESYESLFPQGIKKQNGYGAFMSWISSLPFKKSSSSEVSTVTKKTWHTYYPRIIHFVRRTKDVSTERDLEEDGDEDNDAEVFLKLAQQKTTQLVTELEGWRQSNTTQIGMVTQQLQSSRTQLTDLFALEKSNKKRVKVNAYDL